MSTTESTDIAEPGRIGAVRDFLVSTRYEMEKVSWPPKLELSKATRAVVVGSLLLGVVIGLVDWILTKILVDGVSALTR
jgi:preprotein translocase SecE subunit